ncbi:MAG TPA: cell division protein ZipA C-terminal FtsZ-binding domain-containing protein, partial [Arenicellales bacterium]|nr:cell division protein ZipA C-terminal FtsZ-binding domain-containing protein [Arenicellales bacterium]
GITLFMDIPRTRDPARIFNDMVADAKVLCKRLDGKLVDDNHRGMTQKGLKRIGQEIRSMAAEMEKDGIPPGRDYAMKLF